MKSINRGILWALVLFIVGLFLLLKNLGMFGQWGDVAWGALFLAVGLVFLIWFLTDVKQWWRAIPGFVLLSGGALVLADWRGIPLGDWRGAVILFGIGLGFWAILFVSADNWWALIPAGICTLLGLLVGLQQALGGVGSDTWLAVLFIGLGVIFGLLYILRLGRRSARWAAIPAVALILLGLTTLGSSAGRFENVTRWWPILLIIGALGLLIGALSRQAGPAPGAVPVAEPPMRASGTSITEGLPEVPDTPAASSATSLSMPSPVPSTPDVPVSDKPIDIYEYLRNQPPEEQTPPEGSTQGK